MNFNNITDPIKAVPKVFFFLNNGRLQSETDYKMLFRTVYYFQINVFSTSALSTYWYCKDMHGCKLLMKTKVIALNRNVFSVYNGSRECEYDLRS